MSPALVGGLLTTGPPGKSQTLLLMLGDKEGFPGGLVVENLPVSAGDIRDEGSIPR